MKARVSFLHKKEAEWLKFADWVPAAGELVVYDVDSEHSYARVKLGDGQRTLSELDFFINSAFESLMQELLYSEIIDGGRITNYKE